MEFGHTSNVTLPGDGQVYRLINDPFTCLKMFAADEPQHLTSVKPIDMMAAFLTTEASTT